MTRERGAAAVEFAILVPVLVLLLAAIVGGARLAHARATVAQLADSSARAASLARTAAEAGATARAVTASDAAASGVRCADGVVLSVQTEGFRVPVGQPSSVSTAVRCRVLLADLLLPGTPGAITISAEGRSVLDTFRGRR